MNRIILDINNIPESNFSELLQLLNTELSSMLLGDLTIETGEPTVMSKDLVKMEIWVSYGDSIDIYRKIVDKNTYKNLKRNFHLLRDDEKISFINDWREFISEFIFECIDKIVELIEEENAFESRVK